MMGLIAINKANGPTSRYVTTKVSHLCHVKQAGHAGTLDPMASGVLPVMIGRACKLIQYLPDKKEYIAKMQFGLKTETGDITGDIMEESPVIPTKKEIEAACKRFKGEIMQTPPIYSALKKGGVPLYEYARKNIPVDIMPRKVRIDKVELISAKGNYATIKVACGGGTYIRTLCEDIARECGALATMCELERTMDAGIPISDCVALEDVFAAAEKGEIENLLISPEKIFSHLDETVMEESGVKYYCNGGAINKGRISKYKNNTVYRVYSNSGSFLGLGEALNGSIKAVWVNINE